MLDDNIAYMYRIYITQVGLNNKHTFYVKRNNIILDFQTFVFVNCYTIIALMVLFITDYYVYAIINHKTMYSVVYMFLTN